MAGVEAGGAAAADTTADDDPATILLKLGEVEILTAPWKSVASIQLAGAITPDSFQEKLSSWWTDSSRLVARVYGS